MVIAAGVATLVASLWSAGFGDVERFLLYLLFTAACGPVKLRLPKLDGSFSLNFLPLLVGVAHFTLAETMVAACVGAAACSLINRKTSPTMLQSAFNISALIVTVALCFGLLHYGFPPAAGMLPLRLSVAAAIYFFTSTVLVSRILSLLNGKPLTEVNAQWYSWMFPYYILGAMFIGILSEGAEIGNTPTWLAALPLFHLIHFFYGLTQSKPASGKAEDDVAVLPVPVRFYVSAVILSGFILAMAAAWNWQAIEWPRFAGYLAVTLVMAAFKVRLPFLTGTLSFGFVPVLVAAIEFSFAETVFLAASTAAVQALWKPARRPASIQVAFNVACLMVAASVVFLLSRIAWPEQDLSAGRLVAATGTLYLANTLMVAQVLSMLQRQPLFAIWRQCYFWTLPFYSVGCLIVSLMIFTMQASGWPLSLLVLPLAGMIYVSYRMHVGAAARAVEPAMPA